MSIDADAFARVDASTVALRALSSPADLVRALELIGLHDLLATQPAALGLRSYWWTRRDDLREWLGNRYDALAPDERHALLRAARASAISAEIPDIPRRGALAALRAFLAEWAPTLDPDEPLLSQLPPDLGASRDLQLLQATSLAAFWRGEALAAQAAHVVAAVRRALRDVVIRKVDGWIARQTVLQHPPPPDPALGAIWRALLSEIPESVPHAALSLVARPSATRFEASEGGRLLARYQGQPVALRLVRPPGVALVEGDLSATDRAGLALELLDQWRCGGAAAAQIDQALAWRVTLGPMIESARAKPSALGPGEALGFRIKTTKSVIKVGPVLVRSAGAGLKHTELRLDSLPSTTEEPRDADAMLLLHRIEHGRRDGRADIDRGELFRALVGHPRVFTSVKAKEPAPVALGRLGLRLEPLGEGWARTTWVVGGRRWGLRELAERIVVPLSVEQPWLVVVADDRVEVCRATVRVLAVLERLLALDDLVPPELVDDLVEVLLPLDEIDVSLDPALEGRRVASDPTSRIRLSGVEDALEVELRVQPAPDGRSFPAGAGPAVIRGRDDAGRWVCVRNVEAERRLAHERWRALELDLPAPVERELLPLDAAVELLDALATGRSPGPVDWSGPRRRVQLASATSLKLKLGSDGHLLSIGGEIEVVDGRVPIQAVLDALRSGRRFVQVGREVLVRIHDELAERLERVAAAAWRDRDGVEKMSALAADPLDELAAAGVKVDAPPSFAKARDALRKARAEEPSLPTDLQAELRPYQVEGVKWLLRLGRWGLGGVLADDMGLGKTVQALAALLARGGGGPALIVAPTSMVRTWAREAARFAPRLKIRVHHGVGRATALTDLGPDDVLLTSWGTLVQDAAAIAGCRFHTAVLDEAHAIKNPSTRRASAARQVRTDFVIALTGTPIENHPGELWSLMRVVTPGLLGALEAFEERYGRPIVEDPLGPARDRLAAIVRPFLLRRTKRAVAPDLPARDELVVDVDLSPEERAFYEGVRRAALRDLPDADVGAIAILAALTRLRQAACHAGLIADGFADSAKLRAVRRALADLREAGHRALVFSQFVTLLDVLAEQLQAEGFSVARLDGRCSAVQRDAAVQSFQRGEHDVMLLSLQAGGVGLTLTAATYVLHLDPWWNPAVQDQATDRAHRIGQTDPVTVLHFVAADTVEVGIRALQKSKRAIVDGVLEGAAAAGRLDAAALLALIRDAGDAS
jgi:superfamily II DNA or RNA helicase